MYLKSLLLLVLWNTIEVDLLRITNTHPCPYPSLKNGRYRIRQKSKLIKFWCFTGFELVGNRYATCRDGSWDEPPPVCVKPGCKVAPLENGIQWQMREGAWLVSFCLPGFNLVGSPAVYCDGSKWNTTLPNCVDTKAPSQLSCDFEAADLCGWSHDEVHDFDWKRLNRRTPSSFLKTGPSYDHTFGEHGSGYYMYIESTSRLENDTARLISPVYDISLMKNGCFSFYYHMYGKATGGLRVYQKPDNLTIAVLVQLPAAEKQKYILFEKWGNQDDAWYRDVSSLKSFDIDFQIVIEGIRGSSFTSDIAIDDVAILQGDNCTIVPSANTPSAIDPESCADRCDLLSEGEMPSLNKSRSDRCGCHAACLYDDNCCPDFFEICVFGSINGSANLDDYVPAELPQTEKLVASTASTSSSTTSTTSSTTTITTTPKPVTTTKPTKSTTKRVVTSKPVLKTTTKKISNVVIKPPAPPIVNATGRLQKDVTVTPKSVKPLINYTVTRGAKMASTSTVISVTTRRLKDENKLKKEQDIEYQNLSTAGTEQQSSSGVKTSIITIAALLCCACVAWLAVASRSARGRATLARLRGHTARDPEVRYLNADVDDD